MEENKALLNMSTVVENQPKSTLLRPCTQEEFNEAYDFHKKKSKNFYQSIKERFATCSVRSVFLAFFPVFQWLPQYEFKTNITSDLLSGFTVAVMHIPQGMAYATLSKVNPIVGIYMAIFPIPIYFLMGTSRHVSLGSFSVISIMTANPVAVYSSGTDPKHKTYEPIQVASVICFTVGVIQVLLGFCRVGSLSVFLSESVILGFTSGAAILVFVSQLPHAFGIKVAFFNGIFNTLYSIHDLVWKIPKLNYVALLMFLFASILLFIFLNCIKPRMKYPFLLPVELITMVISTIISYYLNLNKKYSVNIVGSIPIGMVTPSIPPVELIPDIFLDSLTIAIVSFAMNISMATIFAAKENYKIDPNQELLACGLGNMFGGFFSCLPISTSLSRSMLQYLSGGKTQIASVFSSILLLAVILYFATFLEALPYCVLAGIIVVCLQNFILQIKNFPKIWKQSVIDGSIWLSTFLSVILLDIHIGLIVALLMALLSIVLRNQHLHISLLGKISNTDIYLEIEKYSVAQPVPNFIIVQIQAGLHFANIKVAKHKIESLIHAAVMDDLLSGHILLLDMSGVVFVDPSALKELLIFIDDVKKYNITVCLAQCSTKVFEQMKKCDFLNKFSPSQIFPTIQDAVSSMNNGENIR